MNHTSLRWLCLAIATLATLDVQAEPGCVETLNRQRFSGDVLISNGVVQVADTNSLTTNSIEIAELKTLCLLPANTNTSFPRGVLLINGSCLAGKVEAADDTALRLSRSQKAPPVALHRVARIFLRPVPEAAFRGIAASRRGLLLRNNDFVDGDLKAMKDGRIKLESVLFGARTFEASDVAAIILRSPDPTECRFEVRTRDNSLLRLSDVSLAKNELVVSEPCIGSWRLRASELRDLKRNVTATP